MNKQRIKIDEITIKDAIQQRAQLNEACIEDYAGEVANGVKFPPLVVYDDGENLLLTDGRHRYEAYRLSGVEEVEVTIYEGTVRDAILHAVGANASHGLRRTNADKRLAVNTLLKDKEWGNWSDGEIARVCRVSQPFVSKVRNELTQNGFESNPMRKGSDGRILNTSNIGVRPQAEESEDPQTSEESVSPQSEEETTTTDENEESHSSEENGGGSSPDSGSKAFAEMVTSDNDESLVSDQTNKSNFTGSEDLRTETESEQSSGQGFSIDSNSTDSGEDQSVERNDGQNLSDSNDATEADDESSDQNEEDNSGPDSNDVDGADESTSTEINERESNPDSSLEEQTVQEEDHEPEPDDNNFSSEESTEIACENNSPFETEADDSQKPSVDMSQTDEVQALKARIAKLENAIAEKDQRIEELEEENDELQRLTRKLRSQLIGLIDSDGDLDLIPNIESLEDLYVHQ